MKRRAVCSEFGLSLMIAKHRDEVSRLSAFNSDFVARVASGERLTNEIQT